MSNMKEFLEQLGDSKWLMRDDKGTYEIELKEVKTNDGTTIQGHINFNIPIDYVIDDEQLREEMEKKLDDMVIFLQNI